MIQLGQPHTKQEIAAAFEAEFTAVYTLYHNLHHVNDVQRLLNQPESEWFVPAAQVNKSV